MLLEKWPWLAAAVVEIGPVLRWCSARGGTVFGGGLASAAFKGSGIPLIRYQVRMIPYWYSTPDRVTLIILASSAGESVPSLRRGQHAFGGNDITN